MRRPCRPRRPWPDDVPRRSATPRDADPAIPGPRASHPSPPATPTAWIPLRLALSASFPWLWSVLRPTGRPREFVRMMAPRLGARRPELALADGRGVAKIPPQLRPGPVGRGETHLPATGRAAPPSRGAATGPCAVLRSRGPSHREGPVRRIWMPHLLGYLGARA